MTSVLPCAPSGSEPPRRRKTQLEAYLRIARSLRRISRVMNVLTDEELDRLIPLLTERRFEARQLIFAAGELPDRVFLLLKGRVKLYHISDNGKEVIIDIAARGDIVGDTAILEGEDHTIYARALDETVAIMICWDDFFYFVQRSPALAFTMAEIMARRLAGVQRTVMSLVSKPVSGRLADALLDRVSDGHVRLGLTHEEIGQTIGTSRETVTALLSRFVALGAIEPAGNSYRVVDEALLRDIARGAVSVSPRHPARKQPATPKS